MSLLQNTAYGGIMILAVAVLRRVLKDKLVPEARLALWAVCLFRLLTPAAPESVLSLWGLLGRDVQDIPVSGPDVLAPVSGGTFAPAVQMGTAPAPVEGGNPWGTVLAAVWVIVGAALAARFALSYLRTRRAVRCAIPLGRDDPRYAPLPKCARLREGSMDGAPLTFGAVRPTVVLTPGLSGEKLVCVLAHEAVHAKRRDNLWHYVMAAALAVHWWNPAVWLMSRLLRRDIELACDRAAVKKLGAEKRAEYASALLAMAASGSGPAFCQMFGRKAAEERILSVMKFKKTTIFGAVLTVLLVLGVTVAFASSPKTEMPDEDSTTSSAPAGRLPDEVSAYIEKLSAGMSRESVHALMGEPSFSMSSPVFSDSYELDDTHKPQVGIFYDVDGAVTQVKYFSDGTDPDAASIDLTPHLSGSAPAEIPVCPVEGCAESRLHYHDGAFCFLLDDPCPVEGCTTTGCHDHGDGVAYSCNGAGHSDGVCDGSCYSHSTPAYYEMNGIDPTRGPHTAPVSGHHSESHHSGHHK